MSTYPLRQKLITIARTDVGKTEESRNFAPWIAKLWPATNYPEGYDDHAPYCAAGVAWCLREWLKDQDVRNAIGIDDSRAERWRCKSAAAFGWTNWARKTSGVQILTPGAELHTGDIVVYNYSHIEIVVDDDKNSSNGFITIGYNTDGGGSRDGEGCFEKPRSRSRVREFIRILP